MASRASTRRSSRTASSTPASSGAWGLTSSSSTSATLRSRAPPRSTRRRSRSPTFVPGPPSSSRRWRHRAPPSFRGSSTSIAATSRSRPSSLRSAPRSTGSRRRRRPPRRLAGGAPIRRSGELALATRRDACPAASTGTAGSAVDPQLLPAPAHAGGHARAAMNVRLEQEPSRRESGFQLGVLESRDGRPRVEAQDEADLALHHVPDARGQALVEERLSQLEDAPLAQAADRLGDVEGRAE